MFVACLVFLMCIGERDAAGNQDHDNGQHLYSRKSVSIKADINSIAKHSLCVIESGNALRLRELTGLDK